MANHSRTNDTITEAKALITSLQANKAAQLAQIQERRADAEKRLAAANKAMEEAAERLSEMEYAKAKQDKQNARAALDMYKERFAQLQARELITEAESDKVVDSILIHEAELAADFEAALFKELEKLKDLYSTYTAQVEEAEEVLTTWEREIHANYRTRNGGTRVDPETGNHTDRMEHPVKVHSVPYYGSPLSKKLGEYLADATTI